MYAVVGRWLMDPQRHEEQERRLKDEIVPAVKQAPGFLSGYWGRNADGVEHVSLLLFEDRPSAEGFAAYVSTDPEDRSQAGVEPDWFTVNEIIVST